MNEEEMTQSFLQGDHLLLEGLDLRHPPFVQILHSYQHHRGLQYGQMVPGESSQWHSRSLHDHLNVYTISTEGQQHSVLFNI